MITLDSPVTTVLGDKATKRKRLAEGLGIETVGDLLRHFPRRYVKTGELTHVADLQPGEMITVVGEIAVSELRTYRDKRTGRPAYRLETVLQTDGPRLKMTFFAKSQGTASWQAKRLSKGRRGVFGGQVSTFRGDWQLTNPHMVLFGPADPDSSEDGEPATPPGGGAWVPRSGTSSSMMTTESPIWISAWATVPPGPGKRMRSAPRTRRHRTPGP